MTGTPGKVGLVFVSHSVKIAEGLVDLARQMAATTTLVPAGGTDDGGIGTSFTKVIEAITAADSGAGVAILCDLGSAILTAETARDFLGHEVRSRVHIVDAPLVEGGVAAAVTAETGGDLPAVVRAAHSARALAEEAGAVAAAAGTAITRTVILRNKDGLHARPAAEFVTLASSFDSEVTVNGKDAKSLLGIMSLGLNCGAAVKLSSSGAEAEAAVTALVRLIESGFDESGS
ncbi:Phosphocarrier protein HPr /dihydroxyacetone kinase DhaM subunit [Cryobacterium psychrotolerans]|uniref:Phosphocarrier protein HPr n=1 Tax=Cryobacterium psychrotolerans TaxID=386301 RepID=A0A1G8ZGX0_9MICO|nr:dihydroxyacetone kinase phosphoryl donor subunit DhaM [Cryobacterium psychrotolerans]SDK14301.1 Phosphocarrier protein HPr /dihydroxyacetone kinase DhaM subunit [Cryobacterium psychrotolerans]